MRQSNMVNGQVITVGVTDRRLIAAIRAVPRQAFVPSAMQATATVDSNLKLRDKTVSSPSRFLMSVGPFARLIQAAKIRPKDKVLDIGCATGYSSAVLARLSGYVTALEIDEQLAESARTTLAALDIDNVEIVVGPLELGCPERGPYDVIFIGGSVESVPDALVSQLSDRGRLVTIVGGGPAASARLYVKSGSSLSSRKLFHATAHPLPGFARSKSFVF